jgi:hypothetical protein
MRYRGSTAGPRALADVPLISLRREITEKTELDSQKTDLPNAHSRVTVRNVKVFEHD